MSERLQPRSIAEQLGFPDVMSPAFTIVNCPYCEDARTQIGARLAGCLVHLRMPDGPARSGGEPE